VCLLRSADAFSSFAIDWLTEEGNPMAIVYYGLVARAVVCLDQRIFDN
jgi:hypothetical protein